MDGFPFPDHRCNKQVWFLPGHDNGDLERDLTENHLVSTSREGELLQVTANVA